MKYNDYSFPLSLNETNSNSHELNTKNNANPEYIPIENQMKTQIEEIDELDGTENLRFKDNNVINNINPFYQKRLDSCDSSTNYKYSIDIPNVPKNRLHEYLNEDLLNALDVSPNIPKLNNGFQNNRKISISNDINDPNNLIGFSLYNQSNNNSNNNYELNIDNNNKNGVNNYYINNNNYKTFQNYNYTNNNSNNINNQKIYIPTKLRNNDINMENQQIALEGNNQKLLDFKKEEQNNSKNKFDNMNKKNIQNPKKEGKNKKHFELRVGDWTCLKCKNLNFSFRNKCNRCGIPKDLNNEIESINNNMYQNPHLMNNANPNYIYMNNINIHNVNNFNGANYFQK